MSQSKHRVRLTECDQTDRGSFAKVKLAIHRKTKIQLAVKIMDRVRFNCPEKSGGTDIDNEASILRSINHVSLNSQRLIVLDHNAVF